MEAATGSLQETPTWALATVCFVFISISIFIEHLIHLIHQWLKRRRKKALFEVVEKLKSVLMLLGLMSLILAVTQRPIAKFCIPAKVATTMLPCRAKPNTLISHTDTTWDYCGSKGMSSLISQDGVNQLNIFIFVLAVMQIMSSVLIMTLGRGKMKRWGVWEKETQTVEYLASNDPKRFRYTRDTTFGRRHVTSFTGTSIQLWIKCFFRQFFNSVAKVDYITLRHGFISAHLSTNNSFNFQKYIKRSLEDDFKVVVSIRPCMWFAVAIFFLLDAHGWKVYFWLSFVPLIAMLVLGAKLHVIVARMALELKLQNSVITTGAPLVEPNNNLFWFGHPKYVLTLLHFILFVLQFGINSCYHDGKVTIIVKLVLAVSVQVICSYITLPLYALVTQMGCHFKKAILEELTTNAIKQWHADVRRKTKNQGHASPSYSDFSSRRSVSPSDHRIVSRTNTLEFSKGDGEEIVTSAEKDSI